MSNTGKKLRVSEYKALMKNRREEMRQLWCQDGSPVRTLLSVMRIYDDRENNEEQSAGERKCLHAAVWQVRALLVDEQQQHGGRHVFLKLAHGTHRWAFLRQAIRTILTFLIFVVTIVLQLNLSNYYLAQATERPQAWQGSNPRSISISISSL